VFIIPCHFSTIYTSKKESRQLFNISYSL